MADTDIEIGNGTQAPGERFRFVPSKHTPNAVRVTGQRTSGSRRARWTCCLPACLGVREFEPREAATSTQLDRDICLVVDRSGSMMESLDGGQTPSGDCDPPHPTQSRWGALAIAVQAFLVELDKTVQEEHVALVSYSSDTTECGNTYKISTIDSDLVSDYSSDPRSR